MKYALIKDNEVVNVVEWDGVTPWTPPKGHTLRKCDEAPGLECIKAKWDEKSKKFARHVDVDALAQATVEIEAGVEVK